MTEPSQSKSKPAAGHKVVVLVGHGAVARDCPRAWVSRLKALEAQRRSHGAPASPEERELDGRIRDWPRTAANDPYRKGLQALADRLQPHLRDARLVLAFNEFCAPSPARAIDDLIAAGVADISVVPSMLTPGGVHSEIDIPEAIAPLRNRHPHVRIRYAWPVDLDLIAGMLARHLDAFLA